MIDFFAAAAAAFALAGVAMLLNRLTGGRLPRWLTPLAAGAGMLGYAIWAEYSWYERVSLNLPDGVVVAVTEESSAFWRPWTYLHPIVNRFVAIDGRTVKTHPAAPGQKLVRLLVFARWQPAREAPVLFDCPGRRAANLAEGADFAADGTIAHPDWRELREDDPILKVACTEV